MKIFLIRHTVPDVPAGVCYGQTDVDVAASFSEEIESLKKRLKVTEPVKIWSSPLQRCQKLAAEVERMVPVSGEIELQDDLKENYFGEWEMKSWEQIGKDRLTEFRKNLTNNSAPGGESFLQMQERVVGAFSRIVEAAETDLLFTIHAGVIRAIVSHVLGFPIEHLFRLHIDYAGITLLDYHKGKWRLEYLNR